MCVTLLCDNTFWLLLFLLIHVPLKKTHSRKKKTKITFFSKTFRSLSWRMCTNSTFVILNECCCSSVEHSLHFPVFMMLLLLLLFHLFLCKANGKIALLPTHFFLSQAHTSQIDRRIDADANVTHTTSSGPHQVLLHRNRGWLAVSGCKTTAPQIMMINPQRVCYCTFKDTQPAAATFRFVFFHNFFFAPKQPLHWICFANSRKNRELFSRSSIENIKNWKMSIIICTGHTATSGLSSGDLENSFPNSVPFFRISPCSSCWSHSVAFFVQESFRRNQRRIIPSEQPTRKFDCKGTRFEFLPVALH